MILQKVFRKQQAEAVQVVNTREIMTVMMVQGPVLYPPRPGNRMVMISSVFPSC